MLDCFVGSGTTAVAAVNLGRRYIGIELLQRYAALARKNVAEVGEVAPAVGLEPTTRGLTVRCSTN